MATTMVRKATGAATPRAPAAQSRVAADGASAGAAAGVARNSAAPAPGNWVHWAKPVVFAAALYPLARLIFFGATDRLGANPIEFITRSTGLWTLVFLCITLAVTPARRLTGVNELLRLRRMLGLFSFFYATLHFTTYFWFDQWFDLHSIAKDIAKRPFITVGFAAFVGLLPLAVTSTRAMVRRLGRRWQKLHRLIYAIAALAVLHLWWMKAGKNDLILPQIYGTIVALLLAVRVVWWLSAKKARGSAR